MPLDKLLLLLLLLQTVKLLLATATFLFGSQPNLFVLLTWLSDRGGSLATSLLASLTLCLSSRSLIE